MCFFVAALAPFAIDGQKQAKPDVAVTQAESEVLSSYVASRFTGKNGEEQVGSQISQIVIENRTESDGDDGHVVDENGKQISWAKTKGFLHKENPSLQAATLNSFRNVNTHPALFLTSFQLPIAYQLIDRKDFDAIFKNGGWWPDYYRKFPSSQGFLNLSRVGFSNDGKQALFYASNKCGGKCGTGTYVVMEKMDSNWKVAKEILIWIS
jgi:hypothetical protein